MSRYSDIHLTRAVGPAAVSTQLPAINWTLVGHPGPTPVAVNFQGPAAKLPKADIVLLTWTTAEFMALDHVFLQSAAAQSPTSTSFAKSWFQYSRGAPASSGSNALWGHYRLVSIAGQYGAKFTVLLFKSDTHLAHPPWIAGLATMLANILADAQPKRICSIGTAGGGNNHQRLGDVPITNAATLQLKVKDNTGVSYNGQTFTCSSWFPDTTTLLPSVQAKLFFPLSAVATQTSLQATLQAAKSKPDGHALAPYSLSDLLDADLEPADLGSPKAIVLKGTPLLTTDTYYIAPANTPYAALEMDDAVVAHAAQQSQTEWASIRNISDTMVPAQTPSGTAIAAEARQAWSSAVYDEFGVYTSLNSALAAYATIAGASS